MEPFVEHLSSNRRIKYPFRESANLPANIPLDLFVDIVINSDSENISRYYLSRIIRTVSTFQFFINEELVISINVGDSGVFTFQGTDFSGKAVLENTSFFLAPATYDFTVDQTEFEPTVIVDNALRLKSLTSLNNLFTEDVTLQNDVKIAEGFNTVLETQENNNAITINFVAGGGLGQAPCSEDREDIPDIRSINGKEIEGGNLFVQDSACIDIINIPDCNMIVIHDRCEPCCIDCPEQLIDFNNQITDEIDVQLADLDSRLSALENP